MSITTTQTPTAAFERTIADLKQGAAYATAAQTEVSEKAVKTAKDFAAFSQANLEAFTQAGQIFAAGAQELLREVAVSNQAAFAEALSAMRALVAASTVKERVELQATFARTAATRAVAEGSRFAHAGIDLAGKATAPLTARAVAAAEAVAALKA